MWSPEKYIAALRYAGAAHVGQSVPGTPLPYVVHCVQVAMEVQAALAVEPAADPDLAVQCALLHDVVEDTQQTLEQVAATFGPAVAAGVAALSKDPALPKAAAMGDSLARIRQQPREVWRVKLADRISNLMPPPPHWSAARCTQYHAEAQVILDTLGAASPVLAARLASKMAGYVQFCAAGAASGPVPAAGVTPSGGLPSGGHPA